MKLFDNVSCADDIRVKSSFQKTKRVGINVSVDGKVLRHLKKTACGCLFASLDYVKW